MICSGQYTRKFEEAGLYYVWSTFVDEYEIKNYGGTVEVVTAAAKHGEVTVTVAGIEALPEVGGT